MVDNNTHSPVLQNASSAPELSNQPTDNTRQFIVPLSAIGCGIVLGNALVCALFFRYRSLRNVTNTFVISLAVSDLLVAVIFLPTYLTGLRIAPYVIAFILFAYLFNFCGVTFDRHQAILCPLRYHSAMTRTNTYKILAVVWSVPVVLSVVPLFWEFATDDVKATAHQCYTAFLVLVVVICAVFVCWAYARIFMATRKQVKMMIQMTIGNRETRPMREETGSTKRNFRPSWKAPQHIAIEIRAAKVFALVGLTFAICWLPLIIINVFEIFGQSDKIPPVLLDLSLFTLLINALVDPLIYSFFKTDFRAALKRSFHCFRTNSSEKRRSNADDSNKATRTLHTSDGFDSVVAARSHENWSALRGFEPSQQPM